MECHLVGEAGYFEGLDAVLSGGHPLTFGRSRSCDHCVRQTRVYRDAEPAGRQRERSFQVISRVQFRIALMPDGSLEIRAKGQNRTLLDGERLDRAVIRDWQERDHLIAFGRGERIRVTARAGPSGPGAPQEPPEERTPVLPPRSPSPPPKPPAPPPAARPSPPPRRPAPPPGPRRYRFDDDEFTETWIGPPKE